MISYRLYTDNGGYAEYDELETAKEIRRNAGKTPQEWPIKELDVTFFVTNDPETQVIESFDDAMARQELLRQDTFNVDSIKVYTDPQPEGLND